MPPIVLGELCVCVCVCGPEAGMFQFQTVVSPEIALLVLLYVQTKTLNEGPVRKALPHIFSDRFSSVRKARAHVNESTKNVQTKERKTIGTALKGKASEFPYAMRAGSRRDGWRLVCFLIRRLPAGYKVQMG